jgi:esterase/lipase
MGLVVRLGGRSGGIKFNSGYSVMRNKKEFLLVSVVLLVTAAFLWSYVTNPARTQIRFRETGFNTHFTATSSMTFQQYVTATTQQVLEGREKGHVDASPLVVAENSPAILLPDANTCKQSANGKYAKGILLVHGLFDSPYPMQQLGRFYQSQCFLVYVLLLPGHGTVPGDLLQTTAQDWIDAVHFGAEKLAVQVNQEYLGGFSDGGLLVIHEAFLHPDNFAGLFLFAPALELVTKLKPLIPVVYGISKILPRVQWWYIKGDRGLVRYESVPINPVYQTKVLMDMVREQRSKQTLPEPVFVEQDQEDVVIDPQAVKDFFHKNTHPQSHMLWYFGQGSSYPLIHDRRVQVIKSYLPEMRVLSLSHLSLTLPDTDKIYGINGSYKDCLVYDENSSSWHQCENGTDIYYSEITDRYLKEHVLRRITFNPFYNYFLQSMMTFIK